MPDKGSRPPAPRTLGPSELRSAQGFHNLRPATGPAGSSSGQSGTTSGTGGAQGGAQTGASPSSSETKK